MSSPETCHPLGPHVMPRTPCHPQQLCQVLLVQKFESPEPASAMPSRLKTCSSIALSPTHGP